MKSTREHNQKPHRKLTDVTLNLRIKIRNERKEN